MPKKRVPGHLNRRRRRRDGGPNLPRESGLDGTAPEAPPAEPAPTYSTGVPTPTGRPLRPTLRRGMVGAPGRAAAPPPPVEADYSYVIHDLRQIGILAAAGFAILIGLSFVVR